MSLSTKRLFYKSGDFIRSEDIKYFRTTKRANVSKIFNIFRSDNVSTQVKYAFFKLGHSAYNGI